MKKTNNISNKEIEDFVSVINTKEAIDYFESNAEAINQDLGSLNYHYLERAAYYNNMELVTYLVNKFPKEIHYRTKNTCFDALKSAMLVGNREMVLFLLSKGADIFKKYDKDVFSLYFLLSKGQYKLASELIEKYNIKVTEVIGPNGLQIWSQPMIDFNPIEDNKEKIEFFNFCISRLKPGDITNSGRYNYLIESIKSKPDLTFFKPLLDLNIKYENSIKFPCWTPFGQALKEGNELFAKSILKNFPQISAEKMEYINPNVLLNEYNSVADKWTRYYDLILMRTYYEIMVGLMNPSNLILENFQKYNSIYNEIVVRIKKSTNTALFRVNRRMFQVIYQKLPAINLFPSTD